MKLDSQVVSVCAPPVRGMGLWQGKRSRMSRKSHSRSKGMTRRIGRKKLNRFISRYEE